MEDVIIDVRGLEKRFPGVVALKDISFQIRKNAVHCLVGENGAGQTCKVANQIVVALTIEAVGEALLFSSKAGVDPGVLD